MSAKRTFEETVAKKLFNAEEQACRAIEGLNKIALEKNITIDLAPLLVNLGTIISLIAEIRDEMVLQDELSSIFTMFEDDLSKEILRVLEGLESHVPHVRAEASNSVPGLIVKIKEALNDE